MSFAKWRRGPLSLAAILTGSALALLAAASLIGSGAPAQPPATVSNEQPAEKNPAVPVETAQVESGPLSEQITAVGSLVSNESATISPEIAGRITNINFQEGALVEEGTVLFELDSSVYAAQLADAEAKLKLAKQNATRAKELGEYATGRARDEAVSNVAVAEAAVDLAQTQLAKTKIAAPFTGIIGIRRVSVGEFVNVGQDLIALEDITPIKAEFRVPERFLPAVEVGQNIRLTVDAFPGETFEGTVYAIAPQIDVAGRSLLVRAEVPNEEKRLRPGLFARVTLILNLKDEALSVPETALVPQGQDKFVFKVVDGKVQLTKVLIGTRREGRVEIVEGLAQGDAVVTAGHLKIRDGSDVAVIAAAGA